MTLNIPHSMTKKLGMPNDQKLLSVWVGRSQFANRYHKMGMECSVDSSPGSTATRVHTTAGILFPAPLSLNQTALPNE